MKIKKQWNKLALASVLVTSSFFGVTPYTSYANSQTSEGQAHQQQDTSVTAYGNTEKPKNIIFLVGDGMGPSYNAAYRYFADNPDTKDMEPTAFDEYLVGSQRTISADSKDNVTDSAAAATAFSSGHKTYNGAIGVDSHKQTVETVLERAKKLGKSTGLVTTAEVTDATPAAYAAHVDSRDKKDEIATQFYEDRIDSKHKVDVILGGGAKYFGKENGNLDKKFEKDGYDVVTTKAVLAQSEKSKVLGLFSEAHMPLQIDAPQDDPQLVDMQQAALERLSKNDQGFFLMVEGASIDKQGHANDITGVMSEMKSFEKAFDEAMHYAKVHPDTLVIATADHSTGGMTIAKGKDYLWDAEVVRNMKHSGKWMTEQIAEGQNISKTIQAGYGFEVDKKDYKVIKKEANQLAKLDEKKDKDKYEAQFQVLQDAVQHPINEASHTGWTTYGHTGEDVNTYAFGPRSEVFEGNIDNTENAKNIFEFYTEEAPK
ncbi:alkaline phosphatase [Staphylococcus sp. 17KM0847]|uniref:alkaline phosphatase n=1 Tax=Staphylococcus sp. 17KM0847 TaxID=2583989 RepID=UPI0015DC86C5|nr:alkaline phosphatase [Staphylococcus sp. 17KM0847]QLK86857.1 alkaline phosphatase [Staphylococcus sp. 17KM0847]